MGTRGNFTQGYTYNGGAERRGAADEREIGFLRLSDCRDGIVGEFR